MNLEETARFAKIKGLNLLGTGDFTHPKWLGEIRETLTQDADTGLFSVTNNPELPVRYMLTTEVCTIFNVKNEFKKVHHVLLAPSLEVVIQINSALAKYGDLAVDGRPTLNMTGAQLVEEIMQISPENLVFPAHVWTPWFSIFGAFSGFNSMEECYEEMTKHIHALETVLSSAPPMNWRLSKLDRYALVSNSDCHSFWPWRIGREANVFELEKVSYRNVIDAICNNDPTRFTFTIETDPTYGKYHWTGHRKCSVSLSPKEAKKLGNICPVCRRKLTEGVEQRVEDLADRPEGFVPENKPGFKRLLPLSEIIAAVLNVGSPSTQAVWKIYNKLIGKFNDEYSVLLDVSKRALSEVVDGHVADAILRVRVGSVSIVPGYDGVYGKLLLGEPASADFPREVHSCRRDQQMTLGAFW